MGRAHSDALQAQLALWNDHDGNLRAALQKIIDALVGEQIRLGNGRHAAQKVVSGMGCYGCRGKRARNALKSTGPHATPTRQPKARPMIKTVAYEPCPPWLSIQASVEPLPRSLYQTQRM
jgi:hypothetical protein